MAKAKLDPRENLPFVGWELDGHGGGDRVLEAGNEVVDRI